MTVSAQDAALFLRQREENRRNANRIRWQQACADFEKIVNMIVNNYQPCRIYQWGSLLKSDRFSEISDIDIAVEGIGSAEEYFALLDKVAELTDFPVDLIELDKIDPLHAESIRKYGKLIYDRDDTNSCTPGRDQKNPVDS